MIHFHSSDERFCGSQEHLRKFTFEPNNVTCFDCHIAALSSEFQSLTRQSRFIRTMRQRYANDRRALRIILGKVEDGSYERAREAFKEARGLEALLAFDREAQSVYRQVCAA